MLRGGLLKGFPRLTCFACQMCKNMHSVSVTVPGGYPSQGCHGYPRDLLIDLLIYTLKTHQMFNVYTMLE